MIDDELHTILIELMQNSDRYRTVRECSEKGDCPVGGIFSTQRNFVAPLNAGSLEEIMQLVNLTCKVFVIVSLALKVSHDRKLPVVSDTLFYKAQKSVLLHSLLFLFY